MKDGDGRRGLLFVLLLTTATVVSCVRAGGGTGASPTTLPSAATAPLDDQWVVAVSPTIASISHPVVWFRDPVDDHLLVAYDWAGHFAGSMPVRASEPFGLVQSPDGAALVLLHAQPKSGGTLIGRARGQVTWARDDAHLCAFRTESGDAYLPTMEPATPPAPANEFVGHAVKGVLYLDRPAVGSSRRIETFGAFGDHGGPTILSCSVPDDRVIVGENFVASVSGIHALTLSSGQRMAVSSFADRGPQEPAGFVTSPDGRLIGVGSTATEWTKTPDFSVRNVATGASLATVEGGIVTFSDDDSRVLTVTYVGNSSERAVYRLVDWRAGRTLWTAELPSSTVTIRPQSGDVLLVFTEVRPVPGSTRNRNVATAPILVHADGTATTLAAQVIAVGY